MKTYSLILSFYFMTSKKILYLYHLDSSSFSKKVLEPRYRYSVKVMHFVLNSAHFSSVQPSITVTIYHMEFELIPVCSKSFKQRVHAGAFATLVSQFPEEGNNKWEMVGTSIELF